MANKSFKDLAPIDLISLGLIDHTSAITLMQACVTARQAQAGRDTIFMLEHEPVITRGRRSHGQALPFEKEIRAKKIQVCNVDRGGLLTYHGYGQVVLYFVLKIENYFSGVKAFVSYLERVLIDFLGAQKINATTHPEHPGLWVQDKKIASLGLHITQGISSHGICLNVNNDLSVYDLFDPCGLSGKVMTNMEKVLDRKIDQQEFQELSQQLGQAFVKNLGQAPYTA